jgi:Uma2 family endonuclease
MRRREATLEDLAREPGKAELVNGRIVRMSPTGGLPGYAGREIVASLHAYSRRTRTGYAIPDNVAFTVDLPHRRSFAPDAAFYVGELGMGFLAGAPRFAVEVRSKGDYGPAAERRLASKRAEYFAAGTLVVWDVDLLGTDVVRVHRAHDPEQPAVYRRGDVAEAGPAVPGWSMPVDDLFPEATTSRTARPGARSPRRAAGRAAPARSRPRRR